MPKLPERLHNVQPRFLMVYFQMWSGKLPCIVHDGKQQTMTIPEARTFASIKGYSGIRVVPQKVGT